MSEKRKRKPRLSVIGAYTEGLKLAGGTFAFALPFLVLYGIINAGAGYYAIRLYGWAKSADPGTVELAMQGSMGLAGILTLYSLFQVLQRHKASRASWFPAIFWVPSLLVLLMFASIHNGFDNGQIRMIFLTLPWNAWNLVWQSVGGAAMAIVAIRLAERYRAGEPATFGEVLSEARSRTIEVSAPLAGRTHAVLIGIQLLIPGIFYALQLAFAAMTAVLEPESRSLRRSAELTWAIRGKIFRILTIWLVVSFAAITGLAMVLEGPEAAQSSFMDGRVLKLSTLAVQETVWALFNWICQLSLLALYFEQVEREKRREARRARKEAAAAGESPEDAS